MATKPIDRLLFAQGGDCFFCKQPLAKAEASLEHLVAQTHGGKDNDENLVVCCKTLNALLGRMSLKEKLEVILKQRGSALPTSVDKLLNTIKTTLEHQKLDASLAEKLLAQLRSNKWISVTADRVSYSLPGGKAIVQTNTSQ